MYRELFRNPATIARYRGGPYANEREQYLRRAQAHGYAATSLERMAKWLLVIALVLRDNGGSIKAEQLRSTLIGSMERRLGRPPSRHLAKRILALAETWLRTIGALSPAPERPTRFVKELQRFLEDMRGERGLSPVTIANRAHLMSSFFSALPPRVETVGDITLEEIEAFMRAQGKRGWSRASLRTLGSALRSFFLFAASQSWGRANLADGIELPRLYGLEDVPRAPTAEEVDRLLSSVAAGEDAGAIRDHAILSLLIHYGLRRGEVERLTLDDLDWDAEMMRIMRPKLRKPHVYPLSAAVGASVLRYLEKVRPRSSHRSLFLTLMAPFRPLSGDGISIVVSKRLTELGVTLESRGAHCLRHACAGQLLDAGFSMKQISDHLGHRSMSSTQIYTKIDLRGLRQVAELDLGALL